MAGLTLYELNKRDNFSIFLKKIENGESFELIKKKQEELKVRSVVLDKTFLNSSLDIKNKTLFVKTVTGLELTSGALQKTDEFGGQSTDMVYRREIIEQKSIESILKNITVFGLKPIRLSVRTSQGNIFSFDNVFSIKSPPLVKGERRKADFEFINKEGEVLFKISHKSGRKARDFRQWSGLREFIDHPEVIAFGNLIKESLGENSKVFPSLMTIGKKISDSSLKRKAIFGNDEVDFMVQGECKFFKDGDFNLMLEAPLILEKNENLEGLPESHEPILLARRGDLKRNAFGIKGCRGMIYPKSGRKIHKYL